MTAQQQRLWQQIRDFGLDDPGAAFTFSERLARENGWSLTYSLRAVAEYKKFMFLLCTLPHPLTPSEPVDQVWHLHLIYTQSYWIDFCERTLGRLIHHHPTQGEGGTKRISSMAGTARHWTVQASGQGSRGNCQNQKQFSDYLVSGLSLRPFIQVSWWQRLTGGFSLNEHGKRMGEKSKLISID